MRIISCFIFVLVFFITSCTKDEFSPIKWGIEPELEISPLATILTPSHPSDTIVIKTNYMDFKVSKLYWVDIKKIEGTSALVVTAEDFTSDDEYREGYITITVQRGNYKLSRDFVVMQFKKDVIAYE